MRKGIVCPFSRKACIECAIYRGRHCFQTVPRADRRSARGSPLRGAGRSPDRTDFQSFDALRKPESSPPVEGRLRLKLVDAEGRTSRSFDLEEAEAWNWADPTTMRLIDGWHVHSMGRLREILQYKAEKGCEEVAVYEAPRFMLLSGG
ncbi:MAG: hypothetical protein HY900_04120 [Deltaproteobacteria bacterium]|nr:hypothetical protein [Deltaproteobacteria bacterium]